MKSLILLCFLGAAFASKIIHVRPLADSDSDENDEEETFKLNPNNREFVLRDFEKKPVSYEAERLTGVDLVRYVNAQQNLWTATYNSKFNGFSKRVREGLMGVEHVRLSVKAKKNLSKTRFYSMFIPESFDSRIQWPQCQSIKLIRDQSSCGSCWAFGAVEAMSDRICIASKGKIQATLSADDLLSCCTACGFGCNGGEPLAAWEYWRDTGIVTGSNYTMQQGCRPYPFPPCEHHSNKTHFQPCKKDLFPTPKCEEKCQDSYTDHTYNEDKYYGKSAYGVADDVEAIQKELMSHGPLEIAFEVYEDFIQYSGGIYHHVAGKMEGGHAVKLIGWGTEGGVPYWIVANSWNTDFGEDGFFRILRGVDECAIESGVVGGIPKLNVYSRQRKSHRTVLEEDW